MIRMYNQHNYRKQEELEGYWDFTKLEDKNLLPERYDCKMFVPGCWESNITLKTYRGYGAYRKTVFVEEKSNLRLCFKGVSHTADVYFDGVFLAHHYNAFTEFDTVITDVSRGEHEIVVIANNTFSEESALHVPNDYYTYGGIIRPVVMEVLSDVYIKGIRFTPDNVNGVWSAKIEVVLENISERVYNINSEILLDRDVVFAKEDNACMEILPHSQIKLAFTKDFLNVKPWNESSPALYTLNVNLFDAESGTLIDDMIERVGFRKVEVKGDKILLNGQEIFIKGFNRHEDYNEFGCSIPMQGAANDLYMLKDMNINSIRTSHYPNDERFLDMCDELGIFVWEENHARGLNLEKMQNPNFEKQCEDCIDEMIASHYNHPSIIIWGILNECASDCVEGKRMFEKQFNQIKALDKSRPLTFATCRHFTDICLDLVDIVSVNIYFGWYTDENSEEEIEKAYLNELDWIKKSGGEGKPLIISEFGAGALYGYHTPTECKWSEERQKRILCQTLAVYLNRPEINGVYIWQYADCRITEGSFCISRPRSMNNKGVVDEFRRPKMSYETVKEAFGNK